MLTRRDVLKTVGVTAATLAVVPLVRGQACAGRRGAAGADRAVYAAGAGVCV